MALTTLKNKCALVLGVDTAPGRAAAQQLSRMGCRVVCGAWDADVAERLVNQLLKKGGDPTVLILPRDGSDRRDVLRMARERMGHLHVVVNAVALSYAKDEDAPDYAALAREISGELANDLVDRGPTRLITLWPEELGEGPAPPRDDAWHSTVVMAPRQRLDTEDIADLDRHSGKMHLRAGAVGDAIVFLAQFPPTVRPGTLRIDCIPSIEKKGPNA